MSIGECGERGSTGLVATVLFAVLAAICVDSARADYTPVSPCRIVDTRFGTGGIMLAGQTRNFRVYGDVTAQNQGGGGAPGDYPDFCPSPKGEPTAVHINVTVVPQGPRGEGGWAAVWPWSATQPNASWLNYVAGKQNIANAGTAATHFGSATDPDISVQTLRNTHVIIDVLGYFN